MGQKTNPNIFRLGINKTWKTEFFEKKNAELSLYTFKDLEVKDYIERFFEVHGIILHDYKQQYSNSTLNLSLSYFVTSDCNLNKEQFSTILLVSKAGQRKKVNVKQLFKTSTQISSEELKLLKPALNYYHLKSYLNTNTINFQSVNKTSDEIMSSSSKTGVLENMFKTLSLYLPNVTRITASFCCLNKDFSFLKVTQNKKFILLQKFRNTPFLKEGIELLFYVMCTRNSANLLAKFIAFQIKKIKRQKFFLSFLKHSLTVLLNSEISVVKGVKITLKGRLNGVPRAKHTTLEIGDVPVQTISEVIDYSQITVHNSNGSYGIKVWIVEK